VYRLATIRVVTDRRTDRQKDDMRSQDRALHYSASRGNYK